jgi:hypothetical protein
MGRLRYDSTLEPILIDDVTLAHLKIVIGTKLRRQESFMMSWLPADESGDGRLTAWIHPSIPLVIAFDQPESVPVDPERVARMMASVNAHGELIVEMMQ